MLNHFAQRIIKRIFKTPSADQDERQNLEFGGLNPLLAKQLSELETQIGQLVQVQYELSEERQRMRSEMDLLKKAVQNQTASTSEAVPVTNETIP